MQISRFVYELSEVLAEMLVPFLCVKFSSVDNKRGFMKARKYDTVDLSIVSKEFYCSVNAPYCCISDEILNLKLSLYVVKCLDRKSVV